MRTKIIAGNLIAVLVVGLTSYVVVSSQISATFADDATARLVTDREVFERSWRLSGMELLDSAREQARAESSRDLFTALQENGRRERAKLRADQIAALLERRNRSRPELVAITDAEGVVIARNLDPHRMHGEDLRPQLRSMTGVLHNGEADLDVWSFSEGQRKVLQTAIAPIRERDGQVIGTVVIAYDMSNGMAARHRDLTGRDVAIVVEGEVYSSSLDGPAAESLRSALFGPLASATSQALAGQASPQWTAQLGEDEYVGMSGGLPLAASTAVAYAVLLNRSEELAKAEPTNAILVMTLIGLVIVLVYGFMVGTSLLRPIEQMEEGVLAAINGRTDLRLDIQSAELGGLAYRINQLFNVLTGTPEADAQGKISSPAEAWGADALDVQGGKRNGTAGADERDAELAAALSQEPEDAYHERVYQEYIAAKTEAGEDVSNIPKDRFIQRLQSNEASLKKKHDCRMVRFQVQARGTQVNLRPVIIR
jgi:hypothetical protein